MPNKKKIRKWFNFMESPEELDMKAKLAQWQFEQMKVEGAKAEKLKIAKAKEKAIEKEKRITERFASTSKEEASKELLKRKPEDELTLEEIQMLKTDKDKRKKEKDRYNRSSMRKVVLIYLFLVGYFAIFEAFTSYITCAAMSYHEDGKPPFEKVARNQCISIRHATGTMTFVILALITYYIGKRKLIFLLYCCVILTLILNIYQYKHITLDTTGFRVPDRVIARSENILIFLHFVLVYGILIPMTVHLFHTKGHDSLDIRRRLKQALFQD